MDAALRVDGLVVEVEQVAPEHRAALQPDGPALDRIVGRHVLLEPGLAAVVGGGDVGVPDAGELLALQIARGGRAQVEEGGAVVVARHHLGKDAVLDAEARAHVGHAVPGLAGVVGDGDDRLVIAVGVA
jgi:hypothetical protein